MARTRRAKSGRGPQKRIPRGTFVSHGKSRKMGRGWQAARAQKAYRKTNKKKGK